MRNGAEAVIERFEEVAPKTYAPLGKFVQLDVVAAGDRSVGGIILPQNARQLSWITAKVVGAGEKCERVKAGDVVLLAKEGMTEVRHDGGAPCFFTQEEKILAIVTAAG